MKPVALVAIGGGLVEDVVPRDAALILFGDIGHVVAKQPEIRLSIGIDQLENHVD